MHQRFQKYLSRMGVRAAVLGTLSAVLLTGTSAGLSSASAAVQDGDGGQRTSFVHVKVVTKHKPNERFAAPVVEREDDSLAAGETRLVRDGRPGVRDVVYKFVLHNG